MSDQNDPDDKKPEGTPPEGAPPEGQPPAGDAPPEGQPPADDKKPEDELPEWARKELTRVRGEAANYRTKLRDAESRLSEAKTPEEVEAAIAAVREENARLEHAVLVSDVARAYSLPDDLAARLRGTTKDELEADAKSLQKYAEPLAPPGELHGGLDPSGHDDEPADPAALRRKYGRARNRA